MNPLFADFTPPTKSDWLERTERDLKGKSPESLLWQAEQLVVDPFAHTDELPTYPPQTDRAQWEICETIFTDDTNRAVANHEALDALQNGANAIHFFEQQYPEKYLPTLLKDIHLEYVSVHFSDYDTEPKASPLPLLQKIEQFALAQGFRPAATKGSVSYYPDLDDPTTAQQILQWTAAHLPNWRVVTLDATLFSEDYERDVVAELTEIMLHLQTYFECLPTRLLHEHLLIRMGVGKSYWLQIAKIRALKLLYANMVYAYDATLKGALPTLEATCQLYEAAADQNKISLTVQAMAAITAGVDRLSIPASDEWEGEGSDFTRRISRNIQHLMQLESHLQRVADPSAGSFFIEQLTHDISKAVWKNL